MFGCGQAEDVHTNVLCVWPSSMTNNDPDGTSKERSGNILLTM